MKAFSKNRVEAFSDGVFAILITIMVLELRPPDAASLEALQPLWHSFLSYALSFVYLAIYWNNHHHMLHVTKAVNGRVLWANMHLLFWLSLFPFVTAWTGRTHGASIPTALYGAVFFMAAVAYYILQGSIIKLEGKHSELAQAIGSDWKGKISPLCYLSAIFLAFVNPLFSNLLYILVAAMWAVPDRRIEK